MATKKNQNKAAANPRDDFPKSVRDLLEKQVGSICSNRGCRQPTRASSYDQSRSINIGTASHITAASPKGPRYDENVTQEERKSANNGIWLCRNCGTLVDDDESRYPVEILRDWKTKAIEAARKKLTHPHSDRTPLQSSSIVPPKDESITRDRARYDAFIKAFPSNTGLFFQLQGLNANGFSFHDKIFADLNLLVNEWSAAENGFANPAVQAALKDLTKATDLLASYISYNTWPNDSLKDHHHVPPEWEHSDPDRFRKTVDTIHRHVDAVQQKHQNLITIARQELGT